MADDRMEKDKLDKNMGGSEQQYGQQTPGRSRSDDEAFDQRGRNKGTTGRDMDNDDIAPEHGGHTGKSSGRGEGGQDRQDR